MNNLQTIIVGVFMAFFIFAVLIFSGLIKIGDSSSSATPQGKIVIWGTFPATQEFIDALQKISDTNKDLIVTYVKKPEATYQQIITDAIANGTGPDIFLLPSTMIIKNENFISKIPYVSYPEKTFRDSFIDGADVYLARDGVIGFPIVVDPIVLYYNKDLLSNEGLANPPAYWNELFALNGKLTKKKDDGTLVQSMIALGQYDNVTNAKDILATLLLQSNNAIVKRTDAGYIPVFGDNPGSLPQSPAESILNFFAEFSNPSDPAYSWNRALLDSRDMFTSGKLAFYLGHASDLFTIQQTNPNLSFDVTMVPQTKGTNTKRTYARMYASAVNKKSANISAAYGVAGLLATGDVAKGLSKALSLPPASRTLLADKPADPTYFTFFNSSVISRAWLDPDTNASDTIFADLIQNILSNKLSVGAAINKAQSSLELITKK